MEKRKIVERLNINALATAAGRGQRKAVNKIKEITKETEREEQKPVFGHGRMDTPMLTGEQLGRMAEVVKKGDGGKRNS